MASPGAILWRVRQGTEADFPVCVPPIAGMTVTKPGETCRLSHANALANLAKTVPLHALMRERKKPALRLNNPGP